MKKIAGKCIRFILSLISRSPKLYDHVQRIFPKIGGALYISEQSYATNLEDLMAKFYCNQHRAQEGGFYVDVGALDPFRFSNTYALYLAGWRGINIEPRKDSIARFNLYRKGDINLNIGVSSDIGELEYFHFAEPAFNTTNKQRADYVVEQKYSKLLDHYMIKTMPLREIFQRYGVPVGGIDFLAIDVETYELEVLQSNDWEKYRPYFITIESLMSKENGYNIKALDKAPAVRFLLEQDYNIVAKIRNKIFFLDARQ